MAEQAPEIGSTRERLLDAAAKVIARDGYQGARLADVAREAGLTTGAIYSNFRDKQELFLAAFDRVQHLAQNLSVDEEDLGAVLAAAPAAVLEFAHSSERQILNLELALLGTRDPEIHAELPLRRDRGADPELLDQFQHLLSSGALLGLLRLGSDRIHDCGRL